MATIFDDIITSGVRSGQIPARTQEAKNWYRNTAKSIKRINERILLKSEQERLTTKIIPGSMYIFQYDPKTKDDLPYYDKVPLIFPFSLTEDGFYGINMHYLHPQLRARLMDALYDYTNNKRFDESTRIKLNYNLLKNVSKLRFYKPCVKRYLTSHMRSKFFYVYPSEWDIALFLPIAKWEKRTGNYVYAQSQRIIGR